MALPSAYKHAYSLLLPHIHKAEAIFAQSYHNHTPAAHIFQKINNHELADGYCSSFTRVMAL